MPTFRSGWPVAAGLLLLALVPVGSGLYRLADLTLAAPQPDSARFHAAPLTVMLHAAGGSLFMVLGPLQLVAGLRARGWHRWAGRLVIGAGLAAALSGLWMTHSFPAGPSNPELLYGFRMTAGVAWAVFLVMALQAIMQGDILRHRAFMLRALAIGFGAGTSVLTVGIWLVINGSVTEQGNALGQAAAWAINLAIAEIAIARTQPRTNPKIA